MSTIKNLELRDSIRRDALRFMEEENLSYEEAYKKATERLIGDEDILSFEFKPLSTVNNLYKDKGINTEEKSDDAYIKSIKDKLKKIINVDDYTDEQLEELSISHEMGLDVSLFADPKYNVEQLKYLSIISLTGGNIDIYKENYDFNPEKEMEKLAA